MPRGHEQDPLYSLSIRNMVCRCIFLGDKGGHYYIQTLHNDLFSLYYLLLGKLWEGAR